MPSPTVRATCEECGKPYRVPFADRTYPCKACGGTVRPLEEQAATTAEPASAATAAPAPRRPRYQPRPNSRRKLWLGIGAAAVLAAAGILGMRAAQAGEPDLERMAERFAAAWDADSTGRLVALVHPQRQAELRAKLERHRETRGWGEGLPKLQGTLADLRGLEALDSVQATDEPLTRDSLHGYAGGRASVTWQYNPSNTTWYVVDLELTAPGIARRVEGFRDAWASSDPTALQSFFGSRSGEKMTALVEREAAERGWARWPTLGEAELSHDPGGDTLWMLSKVDVTYATPAGELVTRWRLDREADAWVVSGFGFP